MAGETPRIIATLTGVQMETALLKAHDLGTTTLDMNDNIVSQAELQDYSETRTGPTSSAGTLTLDMTLSNIFEVTLTENVTTLNITNPPATGKSGGLTIFIHQDATGSRTITWPASFKWDAGSAMVLSTGANEIDILSAVTMDAGVNWYAMSAGQGMS